MALSMESSLHIEATQICIPTMDGKFLPALLPAFLDHYAIPTAKQIMELSPLVVFLSM